MSVYMHHNMEVKTRTQRTKGTQNSYKWKDEIRKLYAGLEKLARLDEFEEDQKIVKKIYADFERFFEGGGSAKRIKYKFRLLFDKDILEGTFTDEHRAISLLQKQEDSPINGDTILFRAMSINVESEEGITTLDEIINLLIQKCPELIVFPKSNVGYAGITPVHLAILKENVSILESMCNSLQYIHESRLPREKIQGLCASGPIFQASPMMAGTPLGVAALKFNEPIFKLTLKHFSPGLDVTNDKGDTILHSLIKYACVQPEKLDDIQRMFSYVLQCKFDSDISDDNEKREHKKQARKLLMLTNKEKLNAMQLAAKRQQFKIFENIMKSEIYHSRESGDGLFNEEVYDITEIETLNIIEEVDENDNEDLKPDHHESIMEYIVHQETNTAFLFVDFIPVQDVIREKWKSYKSRFIGWFILHLIFMSLLSVASVYRSKLSGPVSINKQADFAYIVTRNAFVTVVSVFGSLLGLVYLVMEIARLSYSRFQYRTSRVFIKRFFRHFNTPYSNMIFRIYFGLFSLLLIIDCVLASTEASGSFSGYENYCLIFAVIIGWYLVMFFLQTFRAFSIFTVLIQKAILDMLKFALVMTFFLVAFSVAMYMIMQGANTEEDDFHNFSTTMLKMLTIMLGLGELGILFQARHPYLAIFVFVLFVLLTTILLLNALIAMMSNSCTDLMNNYGGLVAAKLHCRLQKLSVILFLEGFFPRGLCKEVGIKKKKHRYVSNEWTNNKQRRLWVRSSVHHHNMTETDKNPDHLLYQQKDLHNVYVLLKKFIKPSINGERNNIVEPTTSPFTLTTLTPSKGNMESVDITVNDRNVYDDKQNNILLKSVDIPEVE
ncbi:transient receptor potential cation channel subfamily V member 6-like [Ruditapes philippinarum]|uniref:transient receptor potential cation channel subfamily V member 6-like n=1 Tax=Ruditapes philippinarum TaxID=129788 RepID=UPI00295BB350|nr:transient receptor potential cation channel subfamily V member 6-like [Ruditapes philippinarum]